MQNYSFNDLIFLKQVLSQSSDPQCLVDIKGSICWANPAWKRATGINFSNEQILEPSEFLATSDQAVWLETINRVFSSDNLSAQVLPLAGLHTPSLSWRATLSNDKQWVCLTGQSRSDLSPGHLRSLLDYAGEAIYIHDAHTFEYIYANRLGCKNLGYTLDELLRMRASDIEVGYPLDPTSDEWKQLLLWFQTSGETYHGEGLNRRKDGSVFPVSISAAYQVQDGREVIFVILRDISALIQAEQKLKEQEAKLASSSKMAALGEMSGGVAHEINNPLAIIRAHADILRDQAMKGQPDPAQVLRAADRICVTSDRIARIIRGLRTFARDAGTDPIENVPLKRILEEALELCRARFEYHGVTIRLPDIPLDVTIECRPTQIVQVLINLLNNSHDALENSEEKWVTIEVRDQTDAAEIAVSDSGSGIADHLVDKIMLPFFTTKEVGEGAGLGLSISSGVVQEHGGQLTLDRTSKDTRFVVRLPKKHPESIRQQAA